MFALFSKVAGVGVWGGHNDLQFFTVMDAWCSSSWCSLHGEVPKLNNNFGNFVISDTLS